MNVCSLIFLSDSLIVRVFGNILKMIKMRVINQLNELQLERLNMIEITVEMTFCMIESDRIDQKKICFNIHANDKCNFRCRFQN